MKTIIFILLIFTESLFAQSKNILWIANPEIGNQSSENLLQNIFNKLQFDENKQTLIVTGSITADGSAKNIKKAAQFFKRFPNVHILPGENEESASSLYGIRFANEFEKLNFSFLSDSTVILGINNAAGYIHNKGYFSIEKFNWLDNELENIPLTQKIIVFTNYALARTINAGKFIERFNNRNLVAVFSSDFIKEAYSKQHFATPSIYSSKKEIQKLKAKLVNISNNKLLIKKIDFTDKKLKWKNYKLLQSPLQIANKVSLQKNSAKIILKKNINYSMISEPVIYKNKIIAADKSGLVTCFDVNGKKLWDYDVFGDILCTPTAADGFLAIGTAQGDLITINIKTGESLQTIGFDEAIITNLSAFNYTGSKRLMIPKTGNSNAAIIVGTESGTLYCLDIQTLEEIWHTKTAKGAILIKPILIKNNLFFTSTDGFLYCIDSRDGTLVWKKEFGKVFKVGDAQCQLITDKKNIYLTTTDGFVYSINAMLGQINWGKNYKAWQSIGISSNYKKLLVESTNSRLNILNPENGKAYKIVTMNLDKTYLSTVPLYDRGIFLIASPFGNVVRISKKYSYKKILNLGSAPLHSIRKVKDKVYLASNFEGKLILFKY